MSRYKTDPIVMRRVRQVIYDTGMYNKRLAQALGLNVNTISSWINGRTGIFEMKISWQRLRRMTKNDEENVARGCPFWKELRDLGPCVHRSGQ